MAPPTPPGFSTVKAARSYGSIIHSPFLLPFPPNQPFLRAHNHQVILKPSHCTIQKVATSFPIPRGDCKEGRQTPEGLCPPERTGCYSHTNSNIDEMSVPSSSLPFQVDPAPSWSNFPSSFQSFPICPIGLATARPHLMPSLVSLMSKQLPSKQWASFLYFFHCFEVGREKILKQLQNDYLHHCVLANVSHRFSPESLLYSVLRVFTSDFPFSFFSKALWQAWLAEQLS